MKVLRGLILLLVVAILALVAYMAPRVGGMAAGFAAKQICSAVHVASVPFPEAVADEFSRDNPLVGFMTAEAGENQVTARLAGLIARTAVYRSGLGCTLAVDLTPSELRNQAGAPVPTAGPRGELPWPAGGAGIAYPIAAGVDSVALDDILAAAFEEPDSTRPWRTRAVVVAHRGRLVAEAYGDGWSASRPLLGWSMTKSITNLLVGMRVADDEMDVFAPAAIEAWASDERSAIRVADLLWMSSGLLFDETYLNPLADAPQSLFNRRDAAAHAITRPLGFAPGSRWYYSSGDTNILQELVQDTFDDSLGGYWRYVHERLFDRIGALSAVIEPDASGTFVGSSYMYATARDWARFGQLYLQDGVWDGERIVPEDWVAFSLTPAPAAPRGQYGSQIWLNAGSGPDGGDRFWPRLPRDAYWFSGFDGQWVVVVPSREAVIVRLGMTFDESRWDQEALVASILGALPE